MQAAVCQLAAGLDSVANRVAAAGAVAGAVARGADLVVLPEGALVDPAGDVVGAAEPLDGPFVSALAGALSGTAVVVAGTFTPAGDGRAHNVAVAVGAGGVLAAYRKLHLFDALGWRESEQVEAGDPADPVPVFRAADLTVGVLTCYDLRFPEVARRLAVAGAEALAVPAAWVAGPGKVEQWRVLLQARAIENTCYVLGAAQPGPAYAGCSLVAGPDGRVVAEAGPDGAARVEAACRPAAVAATRSSLPVIAQRRL